MISIIVPTYNFSRPLVEHCLPSIIAQTYQDFEVLVIGDGCTDDTDRLVAKLGDPRIVYYNYYPHISPPSRFCSSVRAANVGLCLARGDWVARLDDDDMFTSDHLAILIQHVMDHDLNFVYGIQDWRGELVGTATFECGAVGHSATMFDRRVFGDLRYRCTSYAPADCDMRDQMRATGNLKWGFVDEIITYSCPSTPLWHKRMGVPESSWSLHERTEKILEFGR